MTPVPPERTCSLPISRRGSPPPRPRISRTQALAAFTVSLAIGQWLQLAENATGADESAARPNIVLIVADDLGYADIGCYGHPTARTPRLDRLAQQGVRFTQHYANGPECSSTRTALMTGRYQQRAGGLECAIGTGNVGRYDDAIRLAERHELGLPIEQGIIPADLKNAGYTCAAFGKWHLGYEPQFNPMRYGWDRFFGCLGGNVDYFTHRELSDLPVLYENDRPTQRSGYMTHLLADEAVRFATQEHANPYFLYVPLTTPHFPYQRPSDEDKVVNADNWTQGTTEEYLGMIEDMDTVVGRILDAVEQSGREKDTLVIFVSDNGGTAIANHAPLRGLKGGLFEGGIRVPLIVRWPGHLTAGSESHQPCITMDLTASLLRVAGDHSAAEKRSLDGMDILAHVQRRAAREPRRLFWRARRGTKTWRAVRDADLKYVELSGAEGAGAWLYDLAVDVGEQHDLSARRPAERKQLRELLAQWEVSVQPSR